MRGVVISLADLTGNMTEPWVEAGYEAFLVDPQHGTTRKEGRVTKFAGTIEEAMPAIGELIRSGNVAMVFGFPPCTHLAIDPNMPEPDDRIHKAPPSAERANIRSVTPMGFARAVFEANHCPALEVAA